MASELWRRIQESMGYTNDEFKIMMADPERKKALEAGPLMVRRKIVAEVIHAKNCAAHEAGAKYIIRGNGVLRASECKNNMCISLLAALESACYTVIDRLTQGEDPKGKFTRYVHCPDTGVNCGGFWEAIVKVTVEE
jgi:uncharacterized repeat protein (TIGR04076 family)